MSVSPKMEYDVEHKQIKICEFYEKAHEFRVRPPYQRKNLWPTRLKQALMDSLLRRRYIPSIVLRLVDLPHGGIVYEVIDGQQRIATVQEFFDNRIILPMSLRDLDDNFPQRTFELLPAEHQNYIREELYFLVDLIGGIGEAHNDAHHNSAADMFWRLQEGIKLNTMERAHAMLSSLARNFIVRYADDFDYDFQVYDEIDPNPDKHGFFSKYYGQNNNRMQHLQFLGRVLLVEMADGPTDATNKEVEKLIDKTQEEGGLASLDYAEKEEARNALAHLDRFCDVARRYPGQIADTGLAELSKDYVTLSYYILLRSILQYYEFGASGEDLFARFILAFHRRLRRRRGQNTEIDRFEEFKALNRLGNETRNEVIFRAFIEFAEENDHVLKPKDRNQPDLLDHLLVIYDENEGLCLSCLSNQIIKEKARVPFTDYQEYFKPSNRAAAERILKRRAVLCFMHNPEPEVSL